jgi:universal stress protein E
VNDTVLCIVELENYPEQVAARAAWLAKLHNCDLEIVLSEPTSNLLGESFVYFADMQLLASSIKNEQDAILRELAASAEELGIAVYTSSSSERPEADMIASKAESSGAKFVVKGAHYHSPSERASFVHTDWQLIRDLGCPLWFVKPTEWKDQPVIVAAVDPTHGDDKDADFDCKIIKSAQAIGEKCDGSLVLFHTYQRLEEIGASVTWKFKPEKLPIDELDEKIREEHRSAIEALAAKCEVPSEAIHQLPARTPELLPTFARVNGASLVVMGAIARSGLKRRIVGSTAARVLDHLPCDVLIVHA